jgi:AraC-like DNA-binding protein
MAGLSTYHFARAFHRSVGMPPHSYLLSQRRTGMSPRLARWKDR